MQVEAFFTSAESQAKRLQILDFGWTGNSKTKIQNRDWALSRTQHRRAAAHGPFVDDLVN